MREVKLIELIFQLLAQHDTPLSSKQLGEILHEHPFYIHKVIEEINIDQQYIDHKEEGYYLRETSGYNQYRIYRKIRTCILLNDYEEIETFEEAPLKAFDKDIRIVGIYHLYQPISSSKTEFLINVTAYRPILQAPMVFVSPDFSEQDFEAIRKTIHQIKARQF